MEDIETINSTYREAVKSLLEGSGGRFFPLILCKRLRSVVEYLKSAEFDVGNQSVQTFLMRSLPKLVEVLLKRTTTRREHEGYIFKTVLLISNFLALSVCQDSAYLCEIRNMLLIERQYSTFYQLLTPEELTTSSATSQGLRLFADCGTPCSSSIPGEQTIFWPDDWERAVGREKAVGRTLEVFVTFRGELEALWLPTRVIEYRADEDLYSLELGSTFPGTTDDQITPQCTDMLDADLLLATRVNLPSDGATIFSLSLKSVIHRWIDRNSGESAYGARNEIKVFHIDEETGGLVKRSRANECRWSYYPMEVLNEFHKQGGLLTMFRSLQEDSSDISSGNTGSSAAFLSSGAVTLPTFKTVLLHLRLCGSLKSIMPLDTYRIITWEGKEAISFALLQFNDMQLKDLKQTDITELFLTLKEMIIFVYDNELRQGTFVALKGRAYIQSALDELDQEIELLYLNFCFHLLKTSCQIQQKLLGLLLIVEKLETVMPQLRSLNTHSKSSSTNYAGKGTMVNSRTHISIKVMQKWIDLHNIIEFLFGESFHQDLASRADSIIIFMAVQRILTIEHLQSIWSTASVAHEAVSKILHDLILRIVPVLSPNLRIQFFHIISNPLSRTEEVVFGTSLVNKYYYTDHVLVLIKNYTIVAHRTFNEEASKTGTSQILLTGADVGTSGAKTSAHTSSAVGRKGQVVNAPQKQWLGFGVLWQLVQDPESSDFDSGEVIKAQAMGGFLTLQQVWLVVDLLLELLSKDFADEREIVLQRCLGNIQIGVSVAVSMKLSRNILEMFPTSTRTWFSFMTYRLIGGNSGDAANRSQTISSVIERLQKYCQLIGVVFSDLETLDKILQEVEDKSNMDDLKLVLNGRISIVPLLPSIKERLRFLRYVVLIQNNEFQSTENSSKLTRRQASSLWNSFGCSTLTPQIFNLYVSFMTSMLDFENSSLTDIFNAFVNSSKASPKMISVKSAKISKDSRQNQSIQVFECGVLGPFFEEDIEKDWAPKEDSLLYFNNPKMATLCFKLFFLVNMDPIKHFPDGRSRLRLPVSPLYFDVDSGCLSCAGDPVGLDLLWHIATKTRDVTIFTTAAKILIEFYTAQESFHVKKRVVMDYGAPSSSGGHRRGYFLEKCFSELSVAVSAMQCSPTAISTHTKQSGVGLTVVEQVARFVYLMRSFVERLVSGEDFGRNKSDLSEASSTPVYSAASSASIEKADLGGSGDKKRQVACGLDEALILLDLVRSESLYCVSFPLSPLEDFLEDFRSQSGNETFSKRRLLSSLLQSHLKAHPNNQDQLLDILDNYLVQNDNFGEDNTPTAEADKALMQRFASDVWHVLQSHPPHKKILSGLESLGSPDGRGKIRLLFDLNSPYRLLYTLQILDSWIMCETIRCVDIQNTSVNSITISAASLSWALEFIGIGGVEHLSEIVLQLCNPSMSQKSLSEHLSQSHLSGQTTPPIDSSTANEGDTLSSMNRDDVSVLSVVMLLRIFHKLLMVDPAYKETVFPQHSSIPSSGVSSFASSVVDTYMPSGLVTSLIDIPNMIMILVNYSYTVLRMEKNANCSISAKRALVQHVTTISFNLMSFLQISIDSEFVENIPQYAEIIQVLKMFLKLACTYSISSSVRTACCRQTLGHLLSNILGRTTSSENVNELKRFEFWVNFFTGIILNDPLDAPQEHVSALLATAIYFGRAHSGIGIVHEEFVRALISKLSQSAVFYSQSTVDVSGSLHDSNFLESGNDHTRIISGYLSAIAISVLESLDSFEDKFLSNIANFIYRNCLFSGSTAAPICCSASSRRLSYNILLYMTKTKENILLELIRSIQAEAADNDIDYSWNISDSLKMLTAPPFSIWNYNPVAAMKTQQFVGLINQGATCYMNSFLQQLFRIESFSNKLLELPDIEDISDNKSVIVHQFKLLISNLKLSEKAVYDTLPFCSNLIDYTGEKINLGEQKDTYEFASSLFDTLESNKPCAELLQSIFRGKLVYLISSLECSFKSEREEPFYLITAEIKNKTTLEDSLQLFIESEHLTGENKYQVDASGDEPARKVDATRRCIFRDLPEVLIVHLKRFDFDLETLSMKKLNDFFAFPCDLDMYPFSEEALVGKKREDLEDSDKHDRSYYLYTLCGILAHSGAINSGHYYSFIRNSDVSEVKGWGTWTEFNDSRVTDFDPQDIPQECFGGVKEGPSKTLDSTSVQQIVRQHNAYILVYRRSSSLSAVVSSPLASPTSRSNLKQVSNKVTSIVLAENSKMLRDRRVISKIHFQFMWKLIDPAGQRAFYALSDPVKSSLVLLILQFTLDVVAKSHAESCVIAFLDAIEDVIENDRSGSCAQSILRLMNFKNIHPDENSDKTFDTHSKEEIRFVTNCHRWILEYFHLCPNSSLVQAFEKLMCRVIRKALGTLSSVCVVPVAHLASQAEEDQTVTSVTGPRAKFLTNVLPDDIEGDQKTEKWYTSKTIEISSVINDVQLLLQQFLVSLEVISPRSVVHRDGFRSMLALILDYISIGYMERILLIQIGAIRRLVRLFIRLSSSNELISRLGSLVEIVDSLCRSTAISPNTSKSGIVSVDPSSISMISPYADIVMSNLSVLSVICIISELDLKCATNRIFLVEGARACPVAITELLRHICWSLNEADTCEVIEFLADCAIEAAFSHDLIRTVPAAGNSFASTDRTIKTKSEPTIEIYSIYFKVFSNMLIEKATRFPSSATLDGPVSKIVTAANNMIARRASSAVTANFIYLTMGLLFRIGTLDAENNLRVHRFRDEWMPIAAKFMKGKKPGSGPLHHVAADL